MGLEGMRLIGVSDVVMDGVWSWPHLWYSRIPMLHNCVAPVLTHDRDECLVWQDLHGKMHLFSVHVVRDVLQPRGNEVWYVVRSRADMDDLGLLWDDIVDWSKTLSSKGSIVSIVARLVLAATALKMLTYRFKKSKKVEQFLEKRNIRVDDGNTMTSSDPVPDTSSSNNSLTTSISAISSDSIDVSSVNVNDIPRVWVPDVEHSLKPIKGHIFVSIDQAYDFYKNYGKLGGFDIKLGTEKNYHGTEVPDIKYFNCTHGGKKRESKYDNHKFDGFSVCNIHKGKGKGKFNSVANGKGKGKVTNDGISVNRKNDDVSNVSKPDDGFSRTGKNIDVAVRSLFRKNTSCKTGCLARMMIRKVDGDMFEVYGFVEEHNHPLVSQDDMQFMMSSRELGFSKQQFMLQVANSNVGPVRAFKLMKEMYGGFENVGVIARILGVT
ncbi:FAR1 DNA binding domain, zinc finger, SWIM-type, MULE transposase domain containing protein [Tanacetum coccineum]